MKAPYYKKGDIVIRNYVKRKVVDIVLSPSGLSTVYHIWYIDVDFNRVGFCSENHLRAWQRENKY